MVDYINNFGLVYKRHKKIPPSLLKGLIMEILVALSKNLNLQRKHCTAGFSPVLTVSAIS